MDFLPFCIIDMRNIPFFSRYDPNVAARVPSNRLRSAIRRARDHYLLPRVPQSLDDFGLMLTNHHEIRRTLDGLDDVFMSLVGPAGHRGLIFMSRRVNRFLENVTIVFSDGTFGSRPSRPHTSQVFQITAVYRNHVSMLNAHSYSQ